MQAIMGHAGVLMKSSSGVIVTSGFLLHFDGANGTTAFIDERGHTFSPYGNAQISTAQSVFGGSSGLFDGSGDYLSAPSSADFSLPADFLLQLRVRFISLPSGGVMTLVSNYASTSSGFALQFRNDSGSVVRFTWGDSTFADFAWSPSINTWYHLAVSRVGNTLRAFINGTQIGTGATFTTNMSGTLAPMVVGALNYFGSYIQGFNGYIDELALTVGSGVSADFTPPTAPLT